MKIREVTCKSALTKCLIEGIDYVVNPYVGCAHGCVYCYASFMKRFCNVNDAWGSFVNVKVNAPERLASQLKSLKRGAARRRVHFSTVCDPYQPVELKYELTKRCLDLLSKEPGLEISVLTKSEHALRDMYIFLRIENFEVGYTITTLDDDLARVFEPYAALPSKRLEALRAFSQAGLRTYVLFGPVLPYFSDQWDAIKEVFSALAAAGVNKVLVDRMNFYPDVRARVLRLVAEKFPEALGYYRMVISRQADYEKDLQRKVSSAARDFDFSVEFCF